MTSDEPTAQPGWRTQDEASAPSVRPDPLDAAVNLDIASDRDR